MNKYFLTFIALVSFVGTVFFTSCSKSTMPIVSRWNDSTIIIDGKINDWISAITYDKETKISYGIQNDSDYFYLLIRPTRQMLRQAIMFGFTVWFDVEGGNTKRFGVRFPIGMANYSHGNYSPMEMQGEFSDFAKQRFGEMLGEFDVLYPKENDKFRFSKYLRGGIDIALNDSLEDAVFEMKIPLNKIEPQDISLNISSLSNPIGVGLEIGRFEREKMKEPFAGGEVGEGKIPEGGMGMGGGGKRGGGMGSGRFPGGPAQQNVALDRWFNVQLASGHF